MEVNKYGRTYQRGKAISDEFRSLIIDEIIEHGGDMITGYLPGSFDEIAKKFKLKKDAVQSASGKHFILQGNPNVQSQYRAALNTFHPMILNL